MSTVYEINKGINKPLEFRGLKAQYIGYLAVGLVGLLLLFAVAFIAGVPVYVCLAVILILGFLLFSQVYKLSNKYGEHGLKKEIAYRRVPSAIVCRTRRVFLSLSEDRAESKVDKDRSVQMT